jgi:hypothetical protein
MVPLSVCLLERWGVQFDIQGDDPELHQWNCGVWSDRSQDVGIPRLDRPQGRQGGHCEAGRCCNYVRWYGELSRHVQILLWVCWTSLIMIGMLMPRRFFYKHELLAKYEWYWRLEPEIKYFCDIT